MRRPAHTHTRGISKSGQRISRGVNLLNDARSPVLGAASFDAAATRPTDGLLVEKLGTRKHGRRGAESETERERERQRLIEVMHIYPNKT